ncbi:hypothetical protein FOE67_18825 [Streptomyces calidiresistens]|uniref:Cobyrinic acid a,c-diamide synthase n=1 Tax=Streptomyces calidiresistens TaxID=1485586 RepID=A0A7W3XXW6_9ACTN|nr:hypothetical protein [Streptomyces calidiresistens]
MSLPAADELFRTTGGAAVQASSSREGAGDGDVPAAPDTTVPAPAGEPEGPAPRETADAPPASLPPEPAEPAVPGQGKRPSAPRPPAGSGKRSGATPRSPRTGTEAPRRARTPRRPSGRERHDEKITVYVSAEELMDLEHARLVLRGEHGLAVDRGRIVREAVAVVLADLESRGDASILVRRLSAG